MFALAMAASSGARRGREKSPGSRAEAPRIPECKFRAGEPGAGFGTDDEKEPFDSAQDRPSAESRESLAGEILFVSNKLYPTKVVLWREPGVKRTP
jgi:hypothetical protein